MLVAVGVRIGLRIAPLLGERRRAFHLEQLDAQRSALQHCHVGGDGVDAHGLVDLETQHVAIPCDRRGEVGNAHAAVMKLEVGSFIHLYLCQAVTM
jgi:hypothetical protein